MEHGRKAARPGGPAAGPPGRRRPRGRARYPRRPADRLPGRPQPARGRADALPPRPAPGRRAGMGADGGGPRRRAPVEAVRRRAPLLGVLHLLRHPQRRRLRRAADAEAGDPDRLPHPYGGPARADARQVQRAGDLLRARPPDLGVHGRSPGLGRHRRARTHRVRRRSVPGADRSLSPPAPARPSPTPATAARGGTPRSAHRTPRPNLRAAARKTLRGHRGAGADGTGSCAATARRTRPSAP